MYKKILLYFLIIFLLSAWQISLVNSLPTWFNNLNVILVIAVYAIGLSKKIFTWCLTICSGLFLDLILFSPFGLYFLGIMITILAIYFLHINFLTNQSLYTYVALIGIATIIFRMWSYSFYILSSFFINIDSKIIFNNVFWFNQFSALVLNVILTTIIFYILTFISRRLTPVFLIPKTK
jgi:cell shape-determining protein MreD